MAEQTAGEKTLPASPRKKQKAREDGNVAKSQDLSSAFTLLVALLALWALGPRTIDQLMVITRHYFSEIPTLSGQGMNLQAVFIQILLFMIPSVAPIMLLLMLGGTFINIAQFGFLFSAKPLKPKFDKLNPITGFQRFVTIRTLVELVKSLTKLTFISYIVWITVRGRFEDILSLTQMSPWDGSAVVWGVVLTVWWRIVLAMLLIGILDYAFQRWQHERDLMMTQQEARQEMREMEGDPRIRQRVRQIQRQMATQRMIAEVPEADVIITNPTTYAIALRYDAEKMQSPQVVAKGARLLAERIRSVAVEHNVPIVERPELARTLFRTMEIGQSVPEDLFQAVAEILAYVYEIDQREEKVQARATANTAIPAMG